jgi:hypothetical protein
VPTVRCHRLAHPSILIRSKQEPHDVIHWRTDAYIQGGMSFVSKGAEGCAATRQNTWLGVDQCTVEVQEN